MAYENFYATTLELPASNSDTTLQVKKVPNTITSGWLVLEARNATQREIIWFAGVSGNTLTGVMRGQQSTGAIQHSAGASVEMNPTAKDFTDALAVNSNIPTYFNDLFSDGAALTGLVWSTVSGLTGAMTSGFIYINGQRITVNAIASKLFTASRDTYIDFDTNGAVIYNAVTNGAAAPAIAADTVRVSKVVTSASAITSIDNEFVRMKIVSANSMNFQGFGAVDANGWNDFGFFYLKEFNHVDATSVAANASIYINVTTSAGNAPVAIGGVFPNGRTLVMVSSASGSTAAQAGLVVSNDPTFSRGFFVFNGGSVAGTWGTRKVTMVIFKG